MKYLDNLKPSKKNNLDDLIELYSHLKDGELRRIFLDKLNPDQQGSLLKLYNLKYAKNIHSKNKFPSTADLTKAVLNGSKLSSIELLYSESKLRFWVKSFQALCATLKNHFLKKLSSTTFIKKNHLQFRLKRLKKARNSPVSKLQQLKNRSHFWHNTKWHLVKLFHKKGLTIIILIVVAIFVPSIVTDQAKNTFNHLQKQVYAQNQNYESWSAIFFGGYQNSANDFDGDGLTNYDEFILKTDPTNSDQNTNEYLDGTDILLGVHPSGNKNTDLSNFSKNIISFRLQQSAFAKTQANSSKEVLGINNSQIQVDTSFNGFLSIPSLRIENVPIIWNVDAQEANLGPMMQAGLVHTKKSALPGTIGKTYLNASNSNLEHAFQNGLNLYDISKLEPRTEIIIRAKGEDGSNWLWKYLVVSRNLYTPGDNTQFEANDLSQLQLNILDTDSQGTKIIAFEARFVEQIKITQTEKQQESEEVNNLILD